MRGFKRVRRIVSVNRLSIRIGECDKTQSIIVRRILDYSGLVRSDGDKLSVFRLDCLVILLQLNELDSAEWSPSASIKQQYNALFAGVIGEGMTFAVSVYKTEIRRLCANTQSVSGGNSSIFGIGRRLTVIFTVSPAPIELTIDSCFS